MKKQYLAVLLGLVVFLGGCGSLPSATVIMVVTATSDPHVIPVTITNTPAPAVPATQVALAATSQPIEQPSMTVGALPSQPTASPAAPQIATLAPAATFGPTATPNLFPTDTRQQIFIAQEDYQGGYMFWIQPTRDLWVLLPDTLPAAGETLTTPISGQWRVYRDTFADGEPEIDSSLTPPNATLFQPRRGFGKLWRNSPDLKAALGWATTPEFGLNTSYVYQPGGYLDNNGKWVAGPGTHFLISLGRNTFEFHEPEPGQAYGTWKKVG